MNCFLICLCESWKFRWHSTSAVGMMSNLWQERVHAVKSCRFKCGQVHPDLNRGAPDSKDKFLRLRDAYSVLSSSESRREYDVLLLRTRRARGQSFSSEFTGSFVPPKQSYYRFVISTSAREGMHSLSICFISSAAARRLAVWCSGNALVLINAVALRRARLVLGWVTAFRQVNRLIT